MSFALRPNASATAATFSATGFVRSIRSRARGPTAIRRMYMSGSFRSESGGPTASIDMAPVPPRATTPRPSSGSTARSNASPPAPTAEPIVSVSPSSGPITTVPLIGSSVRPASMETSAASSAASWSSRPSQRAPASAAHSVARAKSAQGQISSGVLLTT